MPGVVYNVQPQPPVEENTRWFEAGAVTIGVEYRELDPANLVATYAGNAADMAEIEENSPEGGFADEGVSLHVRGTEDGHEYVRFDVFDGEPHYHYVRPTGDHNNVVPFDAVADGDMLPWARRPPARPARRHARRSRRRRDRPAPRSRGDRRGRRRGRRDREQAGVAARRSGRPIRHPSGCAGSIAKLLNSTL